MLSYLNYTFIEVKTYFKFKENIKELISDNRLEEAIRKMWTLIKTSPTNQYLEHQIILLQGQLTAINDSKNAGSISFEEYITKKNAIAQSTLEVLTKIRLPSRSFYFLLSFLGLFFISIYMIPTMYNTIYPPRRFYCGQIIHTQGAKPKKFKVWIEGWKKYAQKIDSTERFKITGPYIGKIKFIYYEEEFPDKTCEHTYEYYNKQNTLSCIERNLRYQDKILKEDNATFCN